MYQKIHLKHRKVKKRNKKNILILEITMVLITTGLLIHALGTAVNPILMQYAEIEAKRISTTMINQAVADEVTTILEEEELFMINKTATGEIQTIDFNPVMVNKVLKRATNIVQEQLDALEKGEIDKLPALSGIQNTNLSKLKEGIVYEIPLGVVSGNALLQNLGPKFPVRIDFVGDVFGNVNTKIDSYGINNAIVEVSIHIELTERVLLPFISKDLPLSLDIPVAIKMVQGKVPTYYQNGLDKNSNLFSLPLE